MIRNDIPLASSILIPASLPSWAEDHAAHRHVWKRKAILQAVYHRWYRQICAWCRPGVTLEIGGGSGNFKEFAPHFLTSDISFAPWLDLQADALRLPIRDAVLDNIVGVNILHHLADIDIAFSEMQRCLRPHGRLVFVEPYISPFSYVVRKLFHHEALDLKREKLFSEEKEATEGNNAMPTIVFWRKREGLATRFPGLRVLAIERHDPLVYPLTGGLGKPCLLPQKVLFYLLRIEPYLSFLCGAMAFTLLIVFERVESMGEISP